MPQIKNKITLNIILIFSIFALNAAYFIQYILDHKPCNLCLIERVPYISAIIIISLSLILKKFEKLIIILLSLIFFFATIISFYHFGIEQGFVTESLVCDVKNSTINLSKEDLLKELQKNTISCKDANFKIFGFSLATINTIISLILSVITIKLFLNYEKTNKNKVEEFIRVDHAGERGAIKIYEGQLLALNTFVKDENLKKTIEEMKIHEKEHCRLF